MSALLSTLQQQALSLSNDERAQLVETLIESLHEAETTEIKEAWAQEIEARVTAYQRGEIEVIPAEEVFAEAKRLLR